MKTKFVFAFLVLVAMFSFQMLSVQDACAVPSFSRAEGISCAACHTIYPQLNSVGRDYKEGGYSFANATDLGDNTTIDGVFPVSMRLNMRLIDKRNSSRSTNATLTAGQTQLKTRSMHEVELYLVGKANESWSYFVELESEDEWAGAEDGFDVQLAHGIAGYAVNDNTNINFGYGSPFWADPYNTVHYRKPMRSAWTPASQGFTPSSAQFLSLSSRVSEKVFVLAAWHGNGGDIEGHDPKNFSGRIAFDVTPDFMVGAYGTVAKAYDPTIWKSTDKTSTYGADFQALVGTMNVHGLVGWMNDDVANTTESTYGLEANMLKTTSSGMLIGPIISISSYTQNDGANRFTQAGLFLNMQHSANIRTQLGWEGDVSLPSDYLHKESRWTAVIDLLM